MRIKFSVFLQIMITIYEREIKAIGKVAIDSMDLKNNEEAFHIHLLYSSQKTNIGLMQPIEL